MNMTYKYQITCYKDNGNIQWFYIIPKKSI